MSAYTKGPWSIKSDLRYSLTHLDVVHSDNSQGAASEVIARVTCRVSWLHEQQANANLIAAAPDLLEALESVLDSIGALTKRHELYGHMSEKEADQVFAAIAKARGEA